MSRSSSARAPSAAPVHRTVQGVVDRPVGASVGVQGIFVRPPDAWSARHRGVLFGVVEAGPGVVDEVQAAVGSRFHERNTHDVCGALMDAFEAARRRPAVQALQLLTVVGADLWFVSHGRGSAWLLSSDRAADQLTPVGADDGSPGSGRVEGVGLSEGDRIVVFSAALHERAGRLAHALPAHIEDAVRALRPPAGHAASGVLVAVDVLSTAGRRRRPWLAGLTLAGLVAAGAVTLIGRDAHTDDEAAAAEEPPAPARAPAAPMGRPPAAAEPPAPPRRDPRLTPAAATAAARHNAAFEAGCRDGVTALRAWLRRVRGTNSTDPAALAEAVAAWQAGHGEPPDGRLSPELLNRAGLACGQPEPP